MMWTKVEIETDCREVLVVLCEEDTSGHLDRDLIKEI